MTTLEEIKQHLRVQFPSTVGNIPLREGFKQLTSEIEALQKQVAALKVEYAKQPEWTKRILGQQSEIDSLRARVAELEKDKELLIKACELSRVALKEYDLLVANGDFYFNCKCHKSGPAQRAIDAAMSAEKK